MKKYLLKSSLHDNKEIVVFIPDLIELMSRAQENRGRPNRGCDLQIEGLDNMEHVLFTDIFSSNLESVPEVIVFSPKEALERIKQERDKLELGLINLEEYEKRKAEWAKYLR